jgi:ribosomal protein S18 acetylase RimI-like enzyme
MPHIRPFEATDWPALWPILHATFATGDTYAFAPDGTEEEIHRAWVEQPMATFVAVSASGAVLGSYTLKPNQPGLGSHVCNCGYVVAAPARGQGLAAAMCEHSQAIAVEQGFRAMQFNLVVATNTVAVRLWQRLGFRIIGTVPGAFRHRRAGYVDAHIMFKDLAPAARASA